MPKKVPKARRIALLKKKLDKAWSEAVRRRDGECVTCGKTENLHAHHWYARKARSLKLRWHTRNGITLCYYCHMYCVHRDGDYQFMSRLFEKCKEIVGEELLAFMKVKAGISWAPTEDELKERLEDLNELYQQAQPSVSTGEGADFQRSQAGG